MFHDFTHITFQINCEAPNMMCKSDLLVFQVDFINPDLSVPMLSARGISVSLAPPPERPEQRFPAPEPPEPLAESVTFFDIPCSIYCNR